MAPILKAGRAMLEQGGFDWLADIAPRGEVRRMLL